MMTAIQGHGRMTATVDGVPGEGVRGARPARIAGAIVGAISMLALAAASIPGAVAQDSGRAPAVADAFEADAASGGRSTDGWDDVEAVSVRGRDLDVDMLREIYEANGNQPIWVENAERSREVFRTLQNAHAHGLSPRAYHVEELAALLSSPDSASNAASGLDANLPEPLASVARLDAELLMTAAVGRYLRHIHVGRVAPRTIDREFDYDRRTIDLGDAVAEVAAAAEPGAVMQSYAPPSDGYADLVGILAEFRSLARDGGWPRIESENGTSDGGAIRPGSRDARVPAMRERLAVSGDYVPQRTSSNPAKGALSFNGRDFDQLRDRRNGNDAGSNRLRQSIGASADVERPEHDTAAWGRVDPALAMANAYAAVQSAGEGDPLFYDDRLAIALERFQRRHGLTVDGIVGPRTLEALNVPIEDRIEQVIAGMERWRWLPRDLGQGYGRYIMVNLAAFSMDVVEDGELIRSMDTVVGRPSRQTPLFSSRMTWLEFNPTWTVPTSIAVRDMLPNVLNDPGYFSRMGITVYGGWHQDSPVLNEEYLDWEQIGNDIRQFRLVQAPGPQNSLGKVKFMMANNFSVYLHDTPSRYLFDRTHRAYSSGCVRVEDPMWLADYVMGDQDGWSGLRSRMQSDWQTRRVNLENHVPVHLAYHTAWRDEDNSIQVREDIYGIDRAIGESLLELDGEGGRYALIMP